MLTTKRKPVTVGEMLVEEFLHPLGLSQETLADAMSIPRKLVNELCSDKRAVSPDTAQMLANALGISSEFWLNVQRRADLWDATNITTAANAHKKKVPVPLSELLSAVDTPEGHERERQYFESLPFPHFEPHPTVEHAFIRIEADGTKLAGRFIDRSFVPLD
jgi:addiction module HigA family antidote